MMFHMFTMIFKKFKIFYSIIITNTVNMVNNFLRFQKSTNFFLHNKMASTNIAITITKRMLWFKKVNVSFFVNFTTFPMTGIFASKLTFFNPRIRHLRKIFFSFIFIPRDLSFFKSSSVWMSFLKRHNNLPKLKAAFRFLTEQQLSYSTLRPPVFRYKKSATLLDNISIAY